ncbi:MAG: leucine-rich repeat domain-containing protein [Candidatus Buchananbacteria bacterium]|nr:leucine-rich repeat domain-containing protein [Candidatus Buchananbacteria bacterium]
MKKMFLVVVVVCAVVLSGCQFGGQNSNNFNIDESEMVPGETALDLNGQSLTVVPSDIFNKINLESLNLSNNQLTGALASQIGQLRNLKVLNLSNNQMTGVPAEVGQLQNLEILDLSNNQITGLPNEIGNLKKLKLLNLSGNNYSQQDLAVIEANLPTDVQIIK